MLAREYTIGRLFVSRIPYDQDIAEYVRTFSEDNGISVGLFSEIGAVKKAVLGYYKQEAKEYSTLTIDEALEIVSCTGNISIRDGKPFLHAHIALSDDAGHTYAGHLMDGVQVFACEFTLQEIIGAPLTRESDAQTGLWLWKTF